MPFSGVPAHSPSDGFLLEPKQQRQCVEEKRDASGRPKRTTVHVQPGTCFPASLRINHKKSPKRNGTVLAFNVPYS